MPITQFLDNSSFDPETRRVVAVAFEMAHVALGLAERSDLANEMIAKRIIELAKTGELNPDLLCEAVLKEFASSTCECKFLAASTFQGTSGAPMCFPSGALTPDNNGQ
jgi:hypothetical protein